MTKESLKKAITNYNFKKVIKDLPLIVRGSCKNFVNVVGTNGGRVPCGSTVDMFGDIKKHYCIECNPL